MRIAYGVHGHGRGHATRALAVLPKLAERHDIVLLAGGDAYGSLAAEHDVIRIPAIEFHFNRRGKVSNYLTIKRNLGGVIDMKLRGPAIDMVAKALREENVDVVISDSEGYTSNAAAREAIPWLTFDRFGTIIHGRNDFSLLDRLSAWSQGKLYGFMFGKPHRVVASSFYPVESRDPRIRFVGPVIRDEVRAVKPTCGNHLVLYLSKGEHEFTPRLEKALLGLDVPVRVYGTPRRGMQDNLHFKPISNVPFIEDLASCRAIISTTGNQLMGEVIHFGKPMLGMPLNCLEQRINAQKLVKMGIGVSIDRSKISTDVLRKFLAREDEYRSNFRKTGSDGAGEAVAAIEACLAELVPDRGTSSPAGERIKR